MNVSSKQTLENFYSEFSDIKQIVSELVVNIDKELINGIIKECQTLIYLLGIEKVKMEINELE